MIKDIQKGLSRKLDKIIDLLIALGKGEEVVKVKKEPPELEEEEEGSISFEELLPPEFVEEE